MLPHSSQARGARPRLAALSTAVPEHVLGQNEVASCAQRLFADSLGDWSRFAPIYGNAAIDTRYSCVPIDWYQVPHGFGDRNRLYVEHALRLAEHATLAAVERASLDLDDIDGIVAVSSSGIATPSLDALLAERLKLRRDLQRLPIFGLGCAGGVLGLARAAQMAMSEPDKRYLLVVVELCGLTFRHADRSKSNLIATALFGDGAAAAVIGMRVDGPTIAAWGEHTWPDSLDIMGWDLRDDGLAVVFSRDIPAWVRRHMRTASEEFLAQQGLGLVDIDAYICHPGGAKVLQALEDAYGLQTGGLVDSRAVLRDFGNMSAATVLFVLERSLAQGRAGRRLLSALGPGFTAAFLVLEG